MIDFGKLSAQLSKGKIIDPTEIFMSLPSKNEKYSYLRNVQAEVLEQWYDNRDCKNNIIKMNTGSGKTTVALLILKSCLNEYGGHAAYVVPDNYLVAQVIKEANELGIQVASTETDISFIQGEAILIINIQKLFNGKSIFGMRNTGNIDVQPVIVKKPLTEQFLQVAAYCRVSTDSEEQLGSLENPNEVLYQLHPEAIQLDTCRYLFR